MEAIIPSSLLWLRVSPSFNFTSLQRPTFFWISFLIYFIVATICPPLDILVMSRSTTREITGALALSDLPLFYLPVFTKRFIMCTSRNECERRMDSSRGALIKHYCRFSCQQEMRPTTTGKPVRIRGFKRQKITTWLSVIFNSFPNYQRTGNYFPFCGNPFDFVWQICERANNYLWCWASLLWTSYLCQTSKWLLYRNANFQWHETFNYRAHQIVHSRHVPPSNSQDNPCQGLWISR